MGSGDLFNGSVRELVEGTLADLKSG